jgi:hypothetical protein
VLFGFFYARLIGGVNIVNEYYNYFVSKFGLVCVLCVSIRITLNNKCASDYQDDIIRRNVAVELCTNPKLYAGRGVCVDGPR